MGRVAWKNKSDQLQSDVWDWKLPKIYLEDKGCEYFSSCLKCPAPFCKYDDPHGFTRWLVSKRDAYIQKLYYKDRVKTKEISMLVGLSKRQIQRIVDTDY